MIRTIVAVLAGGFVVIAAVSSRPQAAAPQAPSTGSPRTSSTGSPQSAAVTAPANLAPRALVDKYCVTCHNQHPDSPKTDWKVGDVRGVVEVILPLNLGVKKQR